MATRQGLNPARPGHPETRRRLVPGPGRKSGKIHAPRHGRPGAAGGPVHGPSPMRVRGCLLPGAAWAAADGADAEERRGRPSARTPIRTIKPQLRCHAAITKPAHSQVRHMTGPGTRAPAQRPAVPFRPDGAGVSGSCPARHERPDFRSLDAPGRTPPLPRHDLFSCRH